MGEARKRKQRRGKSAVSSRLEAAGGDTDVDHCDGQAERVGELAGHRRQQVASVDVEAVVEQEGQGEHGEEAGSGERKATESTGEVCRERQRDHAGDDYKLHRDAVLHGEQ